MLLGAPFVGILFGNYGPRYLLIAGTFIHVFGLMMASLSHEFYQFLLAQGICSAIGASLIFSPSMSCMATWFYKRRGLAMGLTAAGSSIGGVVFPIIVARMIPLVGFGWTMRVCAFLILVLIVIANLTVKSRIKPMRRKVSFSDFVKPWKEIPFLLVGLGTFFYMWGFFLPITFIVRDASANGMSLSMSRYLVSLLNAGSFLGRTVPGLIRDKFGRINTMILMCLCTTILVLALWIPTSSAPAFIVFSVLIGISTGAGISLPPAIIAQISDVREIPRSQKWSLLWSFVRRCGHRRTDWWSSYSQWIGVPDYEVIQRLYVSWRYINLCCCAAVHWWVCNPNEGIILGENVGHFL